MPADHGLRPDDFQSVQQARCRPIQTSKYQTVDAAEGQSLRRFASQHVELMTKRQDLCLQRRSRPEQSDQRQPNQAANISHQPGASPDSTALTFPADLAVTRVSLCCADCRSKSDRIGIVVLCIALPSYNDALDLGDVGGCVLELSCLLGQPKQ